MKLGENSEGQAMVLWQALPWGVALDIHIMERKTVGVILSSLA